MDERSVADFAGVVKVVVKNNFVGVVATKPWQAIQAASKLKATWKDGPDLPDQRTFHEHMRTQPSSDTYVVKAGDVDRTIADAVAAGRLVRATYLHPYQMHGSMGTSCAVADVKADKVTVWSPTQSAYPTRNGVAMILGVPVDNVRVVFTRGSGCYGINGADTVSYDAAILSQAVGRPVRVQLSRRDEMAWENYGLACVIDQRVAPRRRRLRNDRGVGLRSVVSLPRRPPGLRSSRQRRDRHACSASSRRRSGRAQRRSHPAAFRNGSNAAPSYVRGQVGGRAGRRGRHRERARADAHS